MIKSHAELEQWHYKTLKTNPYYAMEGLTEILHEEMMMNMPYPTPEVLNEPSGIIITNTYVSIDKKALELQARIVALETQIGLLLEKKLKSYKVYPNE